MEFFSHSNHASTAFHRADIDVSVSRFTPVILKCNLVNLTSEISFKRKKSQALSSIHQMITKVYIENIYETVQETLDFSTALAGHDYEILWGQALLLFHYGSHYKHIESLTEAAGKLVLAQTSDTVRFGKDFAALLLTARIFAVLFSISREMAHSDTASLFFLSAKTVATTQVIQDYILKELYHAWGRHLHLTACSSQDILDISESLKYFNKAEEKGAFSHPFYLDYAEALADAAFFLGEVKFLKKSKFLLQKALFYLQTPTRTSDRPEYLRGWSIYAIVGRRFFDLTHKKEDFYQADKIFHQAVLILTEDANIWLLWGEMFVFASWIFKAPQDLELGLEKLTSIQCQVADPFYLSALLSLGLSILGIFLEDPNLIKEGLVRIQAALKLNQTHPFLLYGAGMAFLCRALYFGDDEDFDKAVKFFKESLELSPFLSIARHGLFHAYLIQGNYKLSVSLLEKAEKEIHFLTQSKPCSHIYVNEYGVVILCLHNLKKDKEESLIKFDDKFILLEKSLKCFCLSSDLYKESFEAIYNQGCVLIELGNCTQHIDYYDQAIECLLQAHNLKSSVQTYYYLALALFFSGKFSVNLKKLNQAEDILATLLHFEKENDIFWNLLGRVCFELSCLDKFRNDFKVRAEKFFKQAVGLGNIEAHYHLACFYSKEAKDDLAVTYLKKAYLFKALPSREILLEEKHFSNLQKKPEFLQLLEQCESSREQQA
ncbi:tetratricopeptide repeat protein [Candidatus Clavichlamydia salmonicola]|uniref:tetratricopeptide repeat protein n=1 Tax=Candidatus Clavichlamydia salmonicola TaxID=469812 RepID=UPI001890C48C|nr:hypothetical protein [Candidatus Clavichlamydia salmonicola]